MQYRIIITISSRTVIFVVDVKVSFNSYSNSMVASCDQRTIIITNPGTCAITMYT